MAPLVIDLTTLNSSPSGGLFLDAAGNLIGTTSDGTVFELPFEGLQQQVIIDPSIQPTTYAAYGAPITLATLDGTGGLGANPMGPLTADANGNLFGTTQGGGSGGFGTVFEIPW